MRRGLVFRPACLMAALVACGMTPGDLRAEDAVPTARPAVASGTFARDLRDSLGRAESAARQPAGSDRPVPRLVADPAPRLVADPAPRPDADPAPRPDAGDESLSLLPKPLIRQHQHTFTNDELQSLGCLVGGTVGTGLAMAAGGVGVSNVIAGGVVPVANSLTMGTALAGVVFASFCAVGQALTPAAMMVYDHYYPQPDPGLDSSVPVQPPLAQEGLPRLARPQSMGR